jgi:hypothetical protein
VVTILKIMGVMCCGVVLCIGLSGHAVLAADDTNVGQAGERIGGQGGRGFEHVYREHVAAPHSGERIGGQSGQGYEPVKQEHVAAPHPGERIGGQSGRGYEQQKREHIVAHPGERIDGQAGQGETRVMSE